LESLLAGGLEVNEKGAQGRTALHRALGGGHAECARFLISKGADAGQADNLKRTPLHWAAMAPPPGNVECCEIVFESADGVGMMTKETKSGSTPLHSAAGTNRPEVVKFLVDKEADQTLKDEDGLTPWEIAKVRMTMRRGTARWWERGSTN
jgi:ankyrin repeat protein